MYMYILIDYLFLCQRAFSEVIKSDIIILLLLLVIPLNCFHYILYTFIIYIKSFIACHLDALQLNRVI